MPEKLAPVAHCKKCFYCYIPAPKCPNCGEKNVDFVPSRLHPYHIAELHTLPKRTYLIKGLLDCNALSVVFGESNSGKTFFVIDLALTLALGWPWQSHKAKQGAVCYVAAEGGLGLKERLDAFFLHHEIKPHIPFYLIPTGVDLLNTNGDTEELIQHISTIKNLKMVVIDTLSRAMAGGNENSPEDMTAFIHNCDEIREATRAHVLIVHHSGKDRERGARGHSALKAAVDTEIEVIQTDGIITAEVKKQRDGKTGRKYNFTLNPIEVGKDEDGDKIVSCALIASEAQATPRRKIKGQKKRALGIIRDCISDKGQVRHVRQEMRAVMCISLDEAREALKRGNISAAEKADDIRRSISKVITELNDIGVTVSYGDYIWLSEQTD